MNCLRERDEDCYRLSSMQARLFAKSAEADYPSFYFIKVFMHSPSAKSLDNLLYLYSGSSELEIFVEIEGRLTKKEGGTVYPEDVMHWIGYFYRSAAYLLKRTSPELFRAIPPSYLNKTYQAYHGLDIEAAIDRVFADLGVTFLTPQERFRQLYRR